MDPSPLGREIEKISGDAADIVQRGRDMESLGMQMRESAALLKRIADGATGKGYSMDDVRKQVGDVYVDLGKAGERYEPSGTVIRWYGQALSEVQTTINAVVDNCVELWAAYETASSGAATAEAEAPPVDETPEQKALREEGVADAQRASGKAYEDWKLEAAKYDAPYETWDKAYDRAYEGLKDANDRGVEDEWWDDALPFIEGALIVLAIAGAVLAVLAIVIGAPIFALLGAIVGLISLGLTVFKVLVGGRGDGSEIGWAIVGVLPFGKMAKLGDLFKGSGPALKLLKGMGSDLIGITGFLEKGALAGLPALVRNTPVVNSVGRLTQSPGIIRNMFRFGDDLGALPYNTWRGGLDRLVGGGGGELAAAMRSQFAEQGVNYTNRMNNILANTALDGMQNARTGTETFFNLVDSVAKPGQGINITVGDIQNYFYSPENTWGPQIAASR